MAKYSDDELIAALAVARGDARSILVVGLRRSLGDGGAGVARELAQPNSGEAGYVRAAAIRTLASRAGATATALFAERLSDRSMEVQLAAADALAEVGTDLASVAMLSWLERKLLRPTRAANWDPDELRSTLRYANRHGSVLNRLAQLIDAHESQLQDEEHAWLVEVWPDWRKAAHADSGAQPPNTAALAEPMIEDHRGRVDMEELWAQWEANTLDPVLRLAQRRMSH
ncbi:MAG TPA: HEAT repeat domain-containing protein [Nocardioidaceae bacterium]|nr:HEAT repeat domain-containing protein [Nocardioidaceae bacterium]